MWVCLSDLYQLRCTYCSFSSTNQGNLCEFENVKAYVIYFYKKALMYKMINKVNFYIAGGGEPKYSWELFKKPVDFIHYMSEKYGIPHSIGITTNGMLNATQLDYIFNNIDYILVSSDGSSCFQNQNRKLENGNDSSKVVIDSIKYFDQCKINYAIRSTIWMKDFIHLKDMHQYIYSNFKNITNWDIGCVIPRGRAKSIDNFTNLDISKIYLDLKECIYNKKLKDFVTCSKFKDDIVEYLCGTVYGFHPSLLENGKIVTCMDAGKNAIVLGNIEHGNIKLIDYCDTIALTYKKNREECSNCYLFRFCGAVCPLKNESEENLKMAQNDCIMLKSYWNHIFDNLLEDKKYLKWILKHLIIKNYDVLLLSDVENVKN